MAQQDRQWHLGSSGTRVRSPAWYSGLRIQHCHNCGLGLDCGPGSETPYASGQPKKEKEKKEREKKSIKNFFWRGREIAIRNNNKTTIKFSYKGQPFFFYGHTHGMWQFLGEGLTPYCSCSNVRSSPAAPQGNFQDHHL